VLLLLLTGRRGPDGDGVAREAQGQGGLGGVDKH